MADIFLDNMIDIPFTITCGGDKAQAIEILRMPPPPFVELIFDNQPPNKNQGWFITRYEGNKVTIRNAGLELYACVGKGNVQLTPELNPKTCLWYVESAGHGEFKILVPDTDSVWTVNESAKPKNVTLEPANGSLAQLFRLAPAMH